MIEKLADALDSTLDFLYSRGEHYRDAQEAAIRMSFDVFRRDLKFSNEQREWCERVLDHPAAPLTADGWRNLAEQTELALGRQAVASD